MNGQVRLVILGMALLLVSISLSILGNSLAMPAIIFGLIFLCLGILPKEV